MIGGIAPSGWSRKPRNEDGAKLYTQLLPKSHIFSSKVLRPKGSLTAPNSATNWEQSVQTLKPMEDISHSTIFPQPLSFLLKQF